MKPTNPNPKKWLLEQEEKARAAKRQERQQETQLQPANDWIDENDAIRRLTAILGAAAFYEWYDSPMAQALPVRVRIEMMERSIAKHERSLAKEEANGEKSQQEAQG